LPPEWISAAPKNILYHTEKSCFGIVLCALERGLSTGINRGLV
jgi:hypothetical protein